MNEQQPNFLDSRTLIAIAMVGLIWVLWQGHLTRKYPEAFNPPAENTKTTASQEKPTPPTQAAAPVEAPTPTPTVVSSVPEKTLTFEDDQWRFQISSRGMGLNNVTLKKYTDRSNQPFALGAPQTPLFATAFKNGEVIDFDLTQISAHEFRGVAHFQGAEIVKTLKVQSPTYSVETHVEVEHAPPGFAGLSVSFAEVVAQPKSSSLFAPSTERSEVYVAHGTSEDRENLKPNEAWKASYNEVAVVGLGGHYFAMALLDQSDVLPSVTVTTQPDSHVARGVLEYNSINNPSMKLNYTNFMGPKSLNLLRTVDSRMTRMINFGMFSWIARPLLELMKLIYGVVGNWGLAIIVLTLLVRLVVLPINVFSFRSMKAMQAIQPHMKALREKHKEDPKALNNEMMALMKQHKVNPLGGCLPMFLQLPVFLALYAVLGQSIELYKAPFALWINDLSLSDPYFVLPVLMGVSMFVQQKITPSTMDPAQAKVMMFMPIVFSLMMFGLPSGLTLYIFVSTIFGIAQQFIFMKERTPLARSTTTPGLKQA